MIWKWSIEWDIDGTWDTFFSFLKNFLQLVNKKL